MEHTIYNTTIHVVEIERESEIRLSSTPKDIWYWEIFLCTKGSVSKAKAYEPSRNVTIPWMTLESANLLEEVITACKRYMK